MQHCNAFLHLPIHHHHHHHHSIPYLHVGHIPTIIHRHVQLRHRSKINQNRLLVLSLALQHDIVRLNITVDQSLIMKDFHGQAGLVENA